ncbi:MAG: hypothetical protein Q7T25_15395, partial [Sideroxyarcus sp.]|nr:hypothetical protein [Sideroxyarcus sp.]
MHIQIDIVVPMPEVALMPKIAQAISAVGTPGLPAAVSHVLRAVAPYTFTVIFGFCGSAKPLDLYDDFPDQKRKVFVSEYQDGPYLLDPFFLAATRPVAAGLYRMRDLAPDRFYQGEYFRNYYIQTGLVEEIGFFVDLPGNVTVVLSLMRDEKPFSSKEMRALEAIRPVIEACLRRHWHQLSDKFTPSQPQQGVPEHLAIEKSFHSFG